VVRSYGGSFVFFFSSKFFNTAGMAIQATVLALSPKILSEVTAFRLVMKGIIEGGEGRKIEDTGNYQQLPPPPSLNRNRCGADFSFFSDSKRAPFECNVNPEY